MYTRKSIAVVAMSGAMFGLGCEAERTPTSGNEDLGIAAFRTTETSDHLLVEGLDRAGSVIASLDLREGYVEVPGEGFAGEGRELVAKISGITMTHASVGDTRVALPEPGQEPMLAFVTDPFVTRHLDRF